MTVVPASVVVVVRVTKTVVAFGLTGTIVMPGAPLVGGGGGGDGVDGGVGVVDVTGLELASGGGPL